MMGRTVRTSKNGLSALYMRGGTMFLITVRAVPYFVPSICVPHTIQCVNGLLQFYFLVQNASGWTVRASEVRMKRMHSVPSAATAMAGGKEGSGRNGVGTMASSSVTTQHGSRSDASSNCDNDTYYLLSKVEGFTFRNRLVHHSRIEAEFD